MGSNPIMTTKQVSKEFNVTERYLKGKRNKDNKMESIPFHRKGRNVFYERKHVEKFFNKNSTSIPKENCSTENKKIELTFEEKIEVFNEFTNMTFAIKEIKKAGVWGVLKNLKTCNIRHFKRYGVVFILKKDIKNYIEPFGPEFISVIRLIREFDISRNELTANRYKLDRIPFKNFHGKIFYKISDIEEYIKNRNKKHKIKN